MAASGLFLNPTRVDDYNPPRTSLCLSDLHQHKHGPAFFSSLAAVFARDGSSSLHALQPSRPHRLDDAKLAGEDPSTSGSQALHRRLSRLIFHSSRSDAPADAAPFSHYDDLYPSSGQKYPSFRVSKFPFGYEPVSVMRETVEHARMGLQAGQAPELASEGSGGVYLMKDECGTRNVAVFKPMDEEPMAVNNPRGFSTSNYGEGLKKGTRSGEGALREVAAYILDHPGHISQCRTVKNVNFQGFSGVPPTSMVECYHNAFHYGTEDLGRRKAKKGSLQQFVHAFSSCEDMGPSNFPVDEVHKITVLDLRLANTDRNGGNILVCKGMDGGLNLVPIDHGYCLPDKFEDCTFEWLYWPQAQKPYGVSTLEYIKSLDAEDDIELLQQCGWSLGPQIARVFRISTMILKKGAEAGLTPFQIGSIISRGESLDSPSPVEILVEKAENLLPINRRESDFLSVLSSLIDDYIKAL